MSKPSLKPLRGEIWQANLNPTRGHEQSGIRPVLVVSVDQFNHGPADLVVVLPITSKARGIPLHVPIQPPECGLKMMSFIKCEDIRSISKERLTEKIGAIKEETLEEIDDRLRILLRL
jgi:mRNA interferase MazF